MSIKNKHLKRTIIAGILIIALLLILNIVILATGNSYIYGVCLHGYAGISDHGIFKSGEVHSDTFIPVPESVHYNQVIPEAAFNEYLEVSQTTAFLVLKNDSIVFEKYPNGSAQDNISSLFSVAKSITSLLTGIALAEGKLNSIDQKLSDFIPEYKHGLNNKLTIRHLLTMSAGFDWNEGYSNPFSPMTKAYYTNDLEAMVKEQKVVTKPGIQFHYQSICSMVLGYVLVKATGKSLSKYASEKLWGPLGAGNASWSLDHEGGIEKAFCCFNTTARDLSRLGSLVLHKGWFGGKQVVDSSWINESISPAPLVYSNGTPCNGYGYSWWLSGTDTEDFCVMAQGILGQYLIIFPEKDLVIVRLGEDHGETVKGRTELDIYIEFCLKHF